LTRFALLVALVVLLGGGCLAQHEAPASEAPAGHSGEGSHGEGHAGPSIWWKWANFGLLAAALGFLIGKHAPGFFRSRTGDIQKGIAEATRLKEEADARLAEVQLQLKNLEAQIADLRRSAAQEMAVEAERIRQETLDQAAKIQALSEHEIAAAVKSARSQLKAYSAELALELAERKIRERISPSDDARLVGDFVKGLH
jgi:F-type H+-transporting ATPase subunit b